MKNLKTVAILTFSLLILASCSKDEGYTITVSSYTKDTAENYINTGNDLTIISDQECQTWSRTAQGDSHDPASHLHFNAAANVSFNDQTNTLSWTEFGPELDQATIESTCAAAINGADKIVNDQTYYQDKTNLYLKITGVVKN